MHSDQKRHLHRLRQPYSRKHGDRWLQVFIQQLNNISGILLAFPSCSPSHIHKMSAAAQPSVQIQGQNRARQWHWPYLSLPKHFQQISHCLELSHIATLSCMGGQESQPLGFPWPGTVVDKRGVGCGKPTVTGT